jgi:hypothetical protein
MSTRKLLLAVLASLAAAAALGLLLPRPPWDGASDPGKDRGTYDIERQAGSR